MDHQLFPVSVRGLSYEAELGGNAIADLVNGGKADVTCRVCGDKAERCPDIKPFLTPLARAYNPSLSATNEEPAVRRTPPPRAGDTITIDHYPGRRFHIDQVGNYHAGEGWAVDLSDVDDPDDRFSTSLHEEYIEAPWWRPVR